MAHIPFKMRSSYVTFRTYLWRACYQKMSLLASIILCSIHNSIIFYLNRRGLPPQTAASAVIADILDKTSYFEDVSG